MVTFVFFDFLCVFDVFGGILKTAPAAAEQFLNLAGPLSHRTQGQNKLCGQTPHSNLHHLVVSSGSLCANLPDGVY